MNYEFVPISEQLDCGTRIHWDEATQKLYFVDLPNSTVYRYTPADKKLTKAKVGRYNEPLTFMFPVGGSETKFIAGIGRKFAFVEWDGESPEVPNYAVIAEVENEPELLKNRLNGGKVDPWGRLWAGTMGPEDGQGNVVPGKGSLYSVEKGRVTRQRSNVGISNGLAWDTKKMKMYYCDTLEPKIFQYDINNDGQISNEKVIFEFAKNNLEGKPDGLTIDKNGDLWLTSIFGSTLSKIDVATGTIKEKITFPTPQITSVTFGGPKLDDLFVATARLRVDGQIPKAPAGTTYLIKSVGVAGFGGDKYKP
ncbi:unnamed protein product [Phyllotreta striolata]|uniref:SMP-30/Gluconolactonase/LRE-like region domain-containing protein n=1 Tax=Phyllotreta striolata TaxID=444603 RepID=A0A9N9TSD5_PHYSR|nr:unnamed protein product [Phyllotreta striolata]